jgi:hypothetical protein
MENLLVFVLAMILAGSIFVRVIEGEVGDLKRREDPRAFWSLVAAALAGFGGLILFRLAE